jgi:hypothetical protein
MSFVVPATELTDFQDAQDTLRAQLGAQVTFGTPTAPQWPVGTAINPDTSKPFDPTVVQTNSDFTYATITCLIIEKKGSPLRPNADPYFEQSGARSGMDIILDVAAVDYRAAVVNATVFTVNGESFDISEARPFSVGAIVYRWLVYGAAQ